MSVPILNTLRAPRPPAARGRLNPEETVRVAVRVRSREHEKRTRQISELLAPMTHTLPHRRHYLRPEQWDERFAARSDDLDRVAKFLDKKGLSVEKRDPGRHLVVTKAPLAHLQKVFGIECDAVDQEGEVYRTHTGPVLVPKSIEPRIQTVQGLDTTPAAKIEPRVLARTEKHWQVREVGEVYGFPMTRKGAGQTVVIVILGGGFHQQDLDAYFAGLGLSTPRIDVVEVDHAKPQPASNAAIQAFLRAQGFDPVAGGAETSSGSGSDSPASVGWTIELTTDLEIFGALVPEARFVVVFAPNTQDSQAAAIEEALSPDFEQKYGLPTVISCSWGQDEYRMITGSRSAMESALEKAAALGVTVCFASGDLGSAQFSYPASSPHVLACGGTSILSLPGQRDLKEAAWRQRRLGRYYAATAGGMSTLFAAPPWQSAALEPWQSKMRGVPDLAAQASLETGYALIIGNSEVGMGGTSAATPLLAGLLAQIIEANQDLAADYRLGWLTPLLYGEGFDKAFAEIESGDNGLFCATGGWDPCTGRGRPIGHRLLEALRGGA